MTLFIPINSFSFELFNSPEGDLDCLKKEIETFYTADGIKPSLGVKDDIIKVSIDTEKIALQKDQHKSLVALCEQGNLDEALVLSNQLVAEYPTVSEYSRLRGQILSDLGNQEEAINSLINALRWDPKNPYALLMMGNIFAKEKRDSTTALKYYNQAIESKPDDYITLTNIGGLLTQIGDYEKGDEFLNQALQINSNYTRTIYGLALSNKLQKKIL